MKTPTPKKKKLPTLKQMGWFDWLVFPAQTRVFFWLNGWLIVLLAAGTWAQRSMGLFEAQAVYFSSWVWWVGGVLPTPGGQLTLALICWGLLVKLIRMRWRLGKLPSILAHGGVLLLLAAAWATLPWHQEGSIIINDRQTVSNMVRMEGDTPQFIPLPFTLTLDSFSHEVYPGTEIASRYASQVTVSDGDLTFPALIEMNAPLRYKGYTLYQASYVETPQGTASVLAVVKNVGRLFPYLTSGMVALGLLLYIFKRMGWRVLAGVMLALLPFSSHAAVPTADWARLPVQHEGRIKPLDTLARVLLAQAGGSELPPNEWLAEMVFRPEDAYGRPLIRINDAAARRALTLPARTDGLYSMREVAGGFDALGTPPAALEETFAKLQGLYGLSRTLLPDEGTAPLSNLLRIVPSPWPQAQGQWYAPKILLAEGQGSPAGGAYLQQWRQMAAAYRTGDAAAFTQAVQTTANQAAGWPEVNRHRLTLEVAYHAWRPFLWAGIAYALACGLGLVGLAHRRWRRWGIAALASGLAVHSAGLWMRMVILDRPPVGTLYESIVFVAAVAALAGLVMEARVRSGRGLLAGSVVAAVLLPLSHAFAATDTLSVLMAVLDTPFWLTTHVLTITAGYGTVLMAAALAHGWLVQCLLSHQADALFTAAYRATLVGLLLTLFGTALGGVWADYSWGRFWGWDPKENGALLIVLWLLWLLHGRLAGILTPLWLMAGLALSTIVVALAWVGVNLMSVGLHSYGFTQGVTAGLLGFCLVQVLVVSCLILPLLYKGKR